MSGAGGQQQGQPWGLIITALVLGSFAPLIALVGIPTLAVLVTMSDAGLHPGYILLGCVFAFCLLVYLVYLLMALAPQGILIFIGFALYGAIGFLLGSDLVWKGVIAFFAGAFGAVIFAMIGRAAKYFRRGDSSYGYD